MKSRSIATTQKSFTKGVIVREDAHKATLAKVIIKNAPNLISAIPGIGQVIGAVTETIVGATVDYWDAIAQERREKEWESFINHLDRRLSKVEVRQEAQDYFENSIIFKFEDIKRKLFTEPGRGFDELLAGFVTMVLADLTTPPEAKDLILSSLLATDAVDLRVLKQIDVQFRANIQSNQHPGVKVDVLEALMKSSGIDSIMISRSLQRLQAQDLIQTLSSGGASLTEMPGAQGLFEGEKTQQFYPAGGFFISAFGRRFLRFLKLSD